MSNPGVITLVRKTIDGQLLKIEDNIGESVHIHFGDNLRLDLSIAEFMDLAEQMTGLLNRAVDIPGFDAGDFCPIYLNEQMREYADLERIEIDKVRLGELLTEFIDGEGRKYFDSIDKSRVSKALRDGDRRDLLERKQCNLRGDTNQSRADGILASIRKNGYPFNNGYIILHNNGRYIRDGLHRASCLLHLSGDIEAPVLRLHFKDSLHSDENAIDEFMFLKIRESLEWQRPMAWRMVESFLFLELSKLLRGRKVAIKGAGRATLRILDSLDSDVDVRCVISRDADTATAFGVEVIDDSDIATRDVDAILISSAKFHDEMLEEMRELNRLHGNRYLIVDYPRLRSLFVSELSSALHP